ncbi:MAG: hypothetical protein AUG89_00950 [Acidobacteria bacterium 13_1_20CM_4_56_7]|nr:MAG: hypothetical protein AUG89_00950 [Acidobacteria bacterium 13_1_20CM_4_56_7]
MSGPGVFSVLALSLCLLTVPAVAQRNASSAASATQWAPTRLGEPLLRDPLWIYNDWSAYDELSDNIPLTEALAMKELDQIIRLRKLGVHFDYYMMDAFWFAPDGGYRTWRTPNWPNGPDRWIAECRANGILPGLWFGTNELVKIEAAPQWRDSLTAKGGSMSFYEGGFLPDFMKAMQYWYDHGIRMFKFDFVDFGAATLAAEKTQTPKEIYSRNAAAFRDALKAFRQKNSDVVLVAFNGFGGDVESTAGPFPFHNSVDLRWLEVFDSLYSGDPRPSDVPETNFWRSMDIYSDHMVRRYEQSFLPLERIDSTGFMIGNTGTICYRKTNAWKGMLLLMVARGGWVNTIHGNLEFLDDEKAKWFAKVQKIYAGLQAVGRTKTFGGIPGDVQPYGFGSLDSDGAVYTVVNPGQSVQEIEMPLLSRVQKPLRGGRMIFRDAGFLPVVSGNRIMLGPGQMAAAGFGQYAASEFDLGVQEDVRIPRTIAPIDASFSDQGSNTIAATIEPPAKGDLRIIFQQRWRDGSIMRSWPGGPPNGKTVGTVLKIVAEQAGKVLPIEINYDKQVWSGLSWGAGEIKHGDFVAGPPITVRCSSAEKDAVKLEGHLYAVSY